MFKRPTTRDLFAQVASGVNAQLDIHQLVMKKIAALMETTRDRATDGQERLDGV